MPTMSQKDKPRARWIMNFQGLRPSRVHQARLFADLLIKSPRRHKGDQRWITPGSSRDHPGQWCFVLIAWSSPLLNIGMSMRCPSNQALSPVSRILRMKHWGYLKYNPTWRAVSITSSPSIIIYHHISIFISCHSSSIAGGRRSRIFTNASPSLRQSASRSNWAPASCATKRRTTRASDCATTFSMKLGSTPAGGRYLRRVLESLRK